VFRSNGKRNGKGKKMRVFQSHLEKYQLSTIKRIPFGLFFFCFVKISSTKNTSIESDISLAKIVFL